MEVWHFQRNSKRVKRLYLLYRILIFLFSYILVLSYSEEKSIPDRLKALISMLYDMRSSVRCHDEVDFIGAPVEENVLSQNDLTHGDKGQYTVHVASQCLWMMVYCVYGAVCQRKYAHWSEEILVWPR